MVQVIMKPEIFKYATSRNLLKDLRWVLKIWF